MEIIKWKVYPIYVFKKNAAPKWNYGVWRRRGDHPDKMGFMFMMRPGKISAIDSLSGLATITDVNDQEIDLWIEDSPFELHLNCDIWFKIVLTARGLMATGLRSFSLMPLTQLGEPAAVWSSM